MGKISDSQIWSSLYWIVGIFIAFQAMSKSFSQELEGAELLLNTLAHPRSIFFAKAFYYSLFIIILNLISFVLFLLFFGSSFFHGNTFFLTLASLFSGSVGMALTLTFLSALSFKVNQSSALTAILGFPLIMPFLIITTKSLYAALLNDAEALNLSAMNIAIGFLMLLLGSFLVPFFWKS